MNISTFNGATTITVLLDNQLHTLPWKKFTSELLSYECSANYGGTTRCSSSLASSMAVQILWIIIVSCVALFIQAGFMFLEAGSVRFKQNGHILTKGLIDVCIGAVAFYLVGFGFTYLEGTSFIGDQGFAFTGEYFASNDAERGIHFARWFFLWVLASTASSIVSLAFTERARLFVYFAQSLLMMSLVFPFVAHWAWSPTGWASPYRRHNNNINNTDRLFGVGVIDYGGSGVVHVCAGIAALIGCTLVGPRCGQFNASAGATFSTLPPHSAALRSIGTIFIWLSWYGLACSSTLSASEAGASIVGTIVVNVTLSASTGGLGMLLCHLLHKRCVDPSQINAGILAGLVGISAGCATVESYSALIIGVVAAILAYLAAHLLLSAKVDDVVNVIPVHLVGGMWGLLAAGLFSTPELYAMAFNMNMNMNMNSSSSSSSSSSSDSSSSSSSLQSCGLFYACGGNGYKQLGANAVFLFAVIAWSGALFAILFVSLFYLEVFRIPLKDELAQMGKEAEGRRHFSERDRSLNIDESLRLRPDESFDYNAMGSPRGQTMTSYSSEQSSEMKERSLSEYTC